MRRIRRRAALSAIVVTVVLLLGTVAAEENFAKTPEASHYTRASTDGPFRKPGLKPRVYDMPPDQTAQVAAAVVARMPNWSIVESNHGSGTVEAQVTHGLGLLKDEVTIQVLPDGRNARVSVASESGIFEGRLGANAQNIRALQAAMDERLPPAS